MQADVDYEASGYVTPAGMVPPSMYQGGVMPAGYFAAGCDSGCSAPGMCDGMGSCGSSSCGSCDSGCGMGCGGGQCGILGCGGILGKLSGGDTACGGCGMSDCPSCGGLTNMRHMCLFCRGSGCSACQFFGRGYLLGALQCLKPFTQQGICAQRWYDLSAESVFMTHSNGGQTGPLTTLGVAPGLAGDPVPSNQVVLRLGDADGGNDAEWGGRLSAAVICGVGGNLEFTYMGGQKWDSIATVQDSNPVFFSFVSDFGRNPAPTGYPDTDQSVLQSVQSQSEFHSGEINYRRRTMGPYCRFQGSWLVGLRYVRYEDALTYSTLGDYTGTPPFFSSRNSVHNNLFGPQAGLDLWWNVYPGINAGVGVKGAWVQNDIKQRTTLSANSLNPGGAAMIADTDRDTTVMGEFEAKLIYRLNHSWAFRSAYYAIAVDDIAFGTVNTQTINDFATANPLSAPQTYLHSIVLQGVSFGAEYTW